MQIKFIFFAICRILRNNRALVAKTNRCRIGSIWDKQRGEIA